jgi:hypothetical protein
MSELKPNGLSKAQIEHGKAIARRRAINGQPNGYKPISEAELRARRDAELAFRLEHEAKQARRLKALKLPAIA